MTIHYTSFTLQPLLYGPSNLIYFLKGKSLFSLNIQVCSWSYYSLFVIHILSQKHQIKKQDVKNEFKTESCQQKNGWTLNSRTMISDYKKEQKVHILIFQGIPQGKR
jgi:hypothetical protein